MIGLDTNVLIRYIVQDDEKQSKLATAFIESQCSAENPAFINEITLCEVVWVLKRAYRRADFSDYLIARINQRAGCQVTVSFDKKACDSQNFKLLDEL